VIFSEKDEVCGPKASVIAEYVGRKQRKSSDMGALPKGRASCETK